MKTQIKLFGQTIPLEIDEEKVPALLDKFFPAAARAMGQAKELGVDLAPAIQRFIGGSPAVAAPEPRTHGRTGVPRRALSLW